MIKICLVVFLDRPPKALNGIWYQHHADLLFGIFLAKSGKRSVFQQKFESTVSQLHDAVLCLRLSFGEIKNIYKLCYFCI